MTDPPEEHAAAAEGRFGGDCPRCCYVKFVRTERSLFLMCRRAAEVPALRRYPPQPVLRCPERVPRDS